MTNKDYLQKRKQIIEQRDSELQDLMNEYINAIAEFKVGDILKTEYCIIKVTKVDKERFSTESNPTPYYEGIKLKKDLTPFKDGSLDHVLSHHTVTKID